MELLYKIPVVYLVNATRWVIWSANKTNVSWTAICFTTSTPYPTQSAGAPRTTPSSGVASTPRVWISDWAPRSRNTVSRPCRSCTLRGTRCRRISTPSISGPESQRFAIRVGVDLRGLCRRPRWRPIVMPCSPRARKWLRCRRSICCRACDASKVAMAVIWIGRGIISGRLGEFHARNISVFE